MSAAPRKKNKPANMERFEWARQLRRNRKLKPRAKLVAQSIAEHYNGKRAFPSEELIAKDTGQCLSSVRRGVKELLTSGWLGARRRGFAKGYDYTLTIPLTCERNEDHSAHACAVIPLTPERSFRSPVNEDQYNYQTTYQEEAPEEGGNLEGRCSSSAREALAQAAEVVLDHNSQVDLDSLRLNIEEMILTMPPNDPDRGWADRLHCQVIERLSGMVARAAR